MSTMNYVHRKGQIYYGKKNMSRVFTSDGRISKTFAKRFRRGEINNLPKGVLYNSITKRFYLSRRQIPKSFKDLEEHNGVLAPSALNVFDYNIERVDARTVMRQYPTPYVRSKGKRAVEVGTMWSKWNGMRVSINHANTKGLRSLVLVRSFVPDLKALVKQNGSVKVFLSAVCLFTNGNQEWRPHVNLPQALVFHNSGEIQQRLGEAEQKMKNTIETTEGQGSGWVFQRVLRWEMTYSKYQPLKGGTYIKLPRWIEKKTACINVKNVQDDNKNKCALYACLASLYPQKKDGQRTSKYKDYLDRLDFSMVQFPVKHDERTWSIVEEANNICVNIFTADNDKRCIYPWRVSKKVVPQAREIDLLLITNDDKSSWHYVCIKDLSRLVGSQVSKHKCKKHICRYCLHAFTTAKGLMNHKPHCAVHGAVRSRMPKPGSVVEFKHFNNKFKAPFVIYADLECLLCKYQGCENGDGQSWTEKTHKHVPCGFCIYVVSEYRQFSPVVYRGPDCITKMYQELEKMESRITQWLQKNQDVSRMTFREGDEERIEKATHCHICEQPFKANMTRCRDHDHVDGKFIGMSCWDCNINRNHQHWKIPVFFHNLKNYDAHFIIQELDSNKVSYTKECKVKQANGTEKTVVKKRETKVNIIAKNKEKYTSFTFKRLRFLDSCAFLNDSLDSLVCNLKDAGVGKFHHIKRHFPNEEQRELVLRKGVYPYEWCDAWEKFQSEDLPSQQDFYSQLNEEGVSDDDYKHASKVWDTFGMKNFGEYHDLYLKTDVLLLADVFENFRKVSMEQYGLDPCHYVSLPGFSWDAMLKHTKATLELLSDPDMYLFCERGKRGGVSMITHRHAVANNPYLKAYDKSKPNSHIMYLDMNNLYGSPMSGPLPYGGFQWVSVEEFDLNTMTKDDGVGYFLEVDVRYPDRLHDEHNDLPVAPENLTITDDMLSPWATRMKNELDIKSGNVNKLVPNLNDKKKYVCHSTNLAYYMSLGLEVEKVHKVLKFKQRPWMEPYISANTALRAQAKNKFEKDFYKLLNNACFGKSMLNKRGFVDVELATSEKRFHKLTSDPRCSGWSMVRSGDNALACVSRRVSEVVLDQPIYAGVAILELSKVLMYQFHYGYMKETYGPRCRLLFTDTDSLCYHVETEDIYKDMQKDSDRFDTSNYDEHHFLHSNANKKKLGKMKDETAGVPIVEFVGLRAKMYSVLLPDDTNKATAKGVKKCAIKRISHGDYRRCVLGTSEADRRQYVSFHRFQSEAHQVHTVKMNKVSLCAYDDKRYIVDGVSSLAHGHQGVEDCIVVPS